MDNSIHCCLQVLAKCIAVAVMPMAVWDIAKLIRVSSVHHLARPNSATSSRYVLEVSIAWHCPAIGRFSAGVITLTGSSD